MTPLTSFNIFKDALPNIVKHTAADALVVSECGTTLSIVIQDQVVATHTAANFKTRDAEEFGITLMHICLDAMVRHARTPAPLRPIAPYIAKPGDMRYT